MLQISSSILNLTFSSTFIDLETNKLVGSKMAVVSFVIPDSLYLAMKQAIEEEGYASTSEFIRDAIRLLILLIKKRQGELTNLNEQQVIMEV